MKLGMSHYDQKAFLVQNLSLVALLALEIWRHKISLGRGERVIKFGYLPQETFKRMSFYVQNRSSWPKIDMGSILAIFKERKIFGMSWWEKSSNNPPDWSILLKFGQNVS